jgi:LemA protein
MKTKNLGIVAILGALLLFGGCACTGYNGLVGKDESVKKAWNDVQSQYQRRSDLIPNLVNTVKGAANFEQETLTKLMEARAKATSVNVNADNLTPEKLAEFQQAQTQISSGSAARGNRKPHYHCAQRFQRRCAGLQLKGTFVSDEPAGWRVWV